MTMSNGWWIKTTHHRKHEVRQHCNSLQVTEKHNGHL